MKSKVNKLAILVFIPVIVGIGLIIGGSVCGRYSIQMAGIYVLFGGSFGMALIISVITLVTALRPSKSDADKTNDPEKGPDQTEAEAKRLAEINTSYGYDNKIAQAEHQISHSKRAYEHSNVGDKIKGGLFIGFLLTDFVMIIVFAMLRIIPGVITCFVLFGGTIVMSLVIIKIKEHLSISAAIDKKKFDRKTATVETCVMSSSGSAGSGNTTRITSITYRIQLNIDGKTYNAYSKNYYNDGDIVEVWLKKNGSTVRIIDPDAEIDDYSDFDDPELRAAQDAEIAHECEKYRAELQRALDACEDSDARFAILVKARRELNDSMSVYDEEESEEEYYENQLYVKKSVVIAELADALDAPAPKTRAKKTTVAEKLAPADPIEEKHEAVVTIEPAPEVVSEPDVSSDEERPPIAERQESSTADEQTDPRIKRTTVAYKGIKKK